MSALAVLAKVALSVNWSHDSWIFSNCVVELVFEMRLTIVCVGWSVKVMDSTLGSSTNRLSLGRFFFHPPSVINMMDYGNELYSTNVEDKNAYELWSADLTWM